MISGKNRIQKKNEERYQQRKDKQYKNYLGFGIIKSNLSSTQSPELFLETSEKFQSAIEIKSESSPPRITTLRFQNTHQRLLALLFLFTTMASLPTQQAEAMPLRRKPNNSEMPSNTLTKDFDPTQISLINATDTMLNQAQTTMRLIHKPQKIKNTYSDFFKNKKIQTNKKNVSSKELDFWNNSDVYMQFSLTTGSIENCEVSISPSKFELLTNQSMKLNFEIPSCFSGQENTPGITLWGQESKYLNGHSFEYLAQFTNNASSFVGWTCTEESNQLFSYYCSYLEPDSHPDFNVEIDPNNIIIVSGKSSDEGFYTFYNDAKYDYSSVAFGEGNLKECLSYRVGAFQPQSKTNIPDQDIKTNCYKSPESCKLTVYMDKECINDPIGKLTIALNEGIKFIDWYTSQPAGTLLYRLSFKNNTFNTGQDIHISQAANINIENSSDIPFFLSANKNCSSTSRLFSLGWPKPQPLLNFVNTWKDCQNTPSACNVTVNESKKNGKDFLCSTLVGTVLLDIDKGVNSITEDALSDYRLDLNDNTISINKKRI